MISVEEALNRILAGIGEPMWAEEVPLTAGLGRILAEDVTARLTQPPVAVSAMDGYAVRAVDVAMVPARLTIIGTAPAGKSFDGSMGPVRRFAFLPERRYRMVRTPSSSRRTRKRRATSSPCVRVRLRVVSSVPRDLIFRRARSAFRRASS